MTYKNKGPPKRSHECDKLKIVIQKVFNNPVELLFYQSKVKCYLFAYKWQPFTWSLTIPIACI